MKAKAGPPSGFICPDCNGPLWEIRDGKVVKYRCLVGHSFSPQSLMDGETEAVERALWVAVKTLEERSALLRGLAKRTSQKALVTSWEAKARETEVEAKLIREMIKKKGY
jgi:two-component system, chemotaxis family, protein-glutamate methylesterase/glutaminase